MTDEELKAIESAATGYGMNPWDGGPAAQRHVIALVAEVRRMRGVIATLVAEVRRLRKALGSLLDDWERTSAGFPQHIEIRYAVRDRARAALEWKER